MYSKNIGRCDGCAPDTSLFVATFPSTAYPLWMEAPAVMSCVPCEIELCQECHDKKHKLHCSEPPEMYSTKYFFHPEIGA